MDEMAAYSIEELVSQAETAGMTLAEVLSSQLSADEVDRLQSAVRARMAENFRTIESFMADVEVPSLADLCNLPDDELDEMQRDIESVLSDEATALGH